jgi:glycosyltransferase involved in cell wall biosynthesis
LSQPGGGRPALHQLLAAATPHDAVTQQALRLQEELASRGIASGIIAEHVDPALAKRVHRLNARRMPRSPIVLRYSIWSGAAKAAIEHGGPLGVIYHNITPPELVRSANSAMATLCARGRRELPRLVASSEILIADSAYNAEDLRKAGAKVVSIVPLLLDTGHQSIAPVAPSHDILFVGRLVPSKRVEDAIDTVTHLRRNHLPNAHLRLVGSDSGFRGYARALAERAHGNGIGEAVEFLGPIDDDARDAEFARAGAYISMSEHEGFCVPIIEAMGHGVPVVARDAGAVRETAGGAALLVSGRNTPLAAAALSRVLTDAEVRAGLSTNAERRLRELDRQQVAERLVTAVKALL